MFTFCHYLVLLKGVDQVPLFELSGCKGTHFYPPGRTKHIKKHNNPL
ncbi:hypothetical protein HMPREF9303_0893 [Prevotella denticola CRIS 18C-A]|uniref:Uncharacterized protein n=1 Tax=Prevotella denticola CRIS 18C-A TaxID=944557 RepID=F0H9E6_9BACT|nr:hypothetical protein HMPREF9137_1650 [Prevotella denticola F0289]EGC85573.1 hypothetical protein HMPREF9303_0893 [Prevotella denticola CRIS 18C-A]